MAKDETIDSTVVAKVMPQMLGLRSMVGALEIEASLNGERDSTEFVTELMDKMLTAETEEELFGLQDAGTTAGKDFVARPFTLTSDNIVWMRSRPDIIVNGGFPYYALMTVTEIETGEELTLNCGAKTLLATLFRLQRLGGFDTFPDGRPLMIKSKPASAGDVLMLVPVGAKKK